MEILKDEIEKQLTQLLKGEELSEVVALNKVIKSKYKNEEDYSKYKLNTTALPMYFTGDLKSDIVFVELNPGKGLLDTTITPHGIEMSNFELNNKIFINSYEDCTDFYKNFGKYKIEHQINKNQRIKGFDLKQLNFFKGFSAFDLENKDSFDYNDMLNVRQNKLQLEIVPFMSDKFDFKNFNKEYLHSRLSSVISLINLHQRKAVFVCGSEKEIPKIFEGVKMKKYKIDGYKNNVSIGLKYINNTPYIFS